MKVQSPGGKKPLHTSKSEAPRGEKVKDTGVAAKPAATQMGRAPRGSADEFQSASASRGTRTMRGPSVAPQSLAMRAAVSGPRISGEHGPVTMRIGAGDLVNGNLRLGSIAGQGFVDASRTLPMAGRSSSEIAGQIARSVQDYKSFVRPPGAPGSVDISLGVDRVGDIHIDEVVGGSHGTFEFRFTRGEGGSPGLSASPGPSGASSAQAPRGGNSSAHVDLGSGGQFGDVNIRTVVGGQSVSLQVKAPASVQASPEVAAAMKALSETLQRHATESSAVASNVRIDLSHPNGLQAGDVDIGEVVNGSKLDVLVEMPADVTPKEAVQILEGVRQGLEQLRDEAARTR
jgi:hypothetical protein